MEVEALGVEMAAGAVPEEVSGIGALGSFTTATQLERSCTATLSAVHPCSRRTAHVLIELMISAATIFDLPASKGLIRHVQIPAYMLRYWLSRMQPTRFPRRTERADATTGRLRLSRTRSQNFQR